ncbi:hypothetical protein BD770DRAFT_122511 [Pilaira anomala]|nr:hypothetical protein BD770DRAFT_122511 [Pilaira anomala]
MLTAKFASLSEDFYNYTETGSNATLPKLMLHPYVPTTKESDTNILSVLLRTKLIPDIEKLEADTQATISQELLMDSNQNNNFAGKNLDDEQLIQSQLKQWNQLLQRHDRLAVNATKYVTELASDHKPNFLLRIEDQMDVSDDEDMESDEDEEKKPEEEWEKMGFPSQDVWKKWKLECMMNFYSSGKSEVVGSDIKKLASNVKK